MRFSSFPCLWSSSALSAGEFLDKYLVSVLRVQDGGEKTFFGGERR